MKYYSTNNKSAKVSLKDAVLKGLAPDNGLYMPENFTVLSESFYKNISSMSFAEIAYTVAKELFNSEDVELAVLKQIVEEAFNFDIPLVPIHDNISTLELFHGPTLAFKDVGARFMARLLKHFTKGNDKQFNILVATSGDTGSAVANGFLGVEGVHVYVLYPKGLVSEIQEKQFTTLGQNITALEIAGNFDDCQRLVKQAFLDKELNERLVLTSANSINLARCLPQSFYYFWAYAQTVDKERPFVISVPSGNFGNIFGALVAKRMGLPVAKFITATNVNDIVPKYLENGKFEPRNSVATIANAMDVGNPSNFVRMLDLYNQSHEQMTADIVGYSYTDNQIREIIQETYRKHNYLLDPHGAIGYEALKTYLKTNPTANGVFVETAHPAKFKDVMEEIIESPIEIPAKLQKFMAGKKQSIELSNEFGGFKEFLLRKSL